MSAASLDDLRRRGDNAPVQRFVSLAFVAAVLGLGACGGDDAEGAEAGVGGDRSGCAEPGSHSVEISAHSCACEPGYDWCGEALDDFVCCPVEATDTGGAEALPPEAPCGEEQLEALACVEDPELPGPADARVWACNGERWVEAPGYATFECAAQGFAFAYGCLAGPEFLCGYGPGTTCEEAEYGSVCVDEDIIDTCVWGRRTVDRCSRLCAELEVFGPGLSGGSCVEAEPPNSGPASCLCE